MKQVKLFSYFIAALCLMFAGVSCEKESAETPVEKPTIGILDAEFNAEKMSATVTIAPSSNASAWYYKVESADAPADYTKVDGAAAQEVSFAVVYGVEYTISAYAENGGGKSDVATKKFCQMPEGEVAIAIGDVTLDTKTMKAKATIYPSSNATKWYWKSTVKDGEATEWNVVEGNKEQEISFAYEYGKSYVITAYAECGAISSDEATKECYFEPAEPTITVSDARFDDSTMTISFDVTPSADTHHWYWGIKSDAASPSEYEQYEGSEPRTVSCTIEYGVEYTFLFRAENVILKGEQKEVEFMAWGKVGDITIANLTAYSVDVNIAKNEKCVKYVVGAMHSSAYDRDTFIEEAQTSLNPDEDYPFVVFNSATESRTFSEQDLVRNSLVGSDINAGILLVPGITYTVAVYGEDESGNHNVTTTSFTVPKAELNGDVEVAIEVSDITETSATATVTAEEGCKILMGYIDPAVTKADTESPFDFEGKSEEEIRNYIVGAANSIPEIYTEPVTRLLSNVFAIGAEYYAYAIAIKDGKLGKVSFEKFVTRTPSLTGTSKITSVELMEQTTHDILTVKLTTDSNAKSVRLYAAPATDHASYKDNLEYIMDADSYQNYREVYEVVDGVATADVNIYHPGTNYYLYAVAVDQNDKAGEMVCVAKMAGLDTDYCTTIEEIIDDGNINFSGSGTVDLVVTVVGQVDDRISVTVNTDSRSANAEKVWLIRFNGMIEDIEENVRYAFSEYAERNKVLGAYKEAKVGYPLKYEDGGSSFDPKYEALQEYDATWGGDILVAVVLDTTGKFNIYSYYAAGQSVTLY